MFHALYDSPWHHPGIAWLVGVPLLFIALGRAFRAQRSFALLFVVLQVEIMLDAWFTGPYSPVGNTGRAADLAAVVFVVLGDLRYFYLVLRQQRPRGTALGLGFALSMVMPLVTGALRVVDASRFSGNLLYLIYEFGVLAVVIVVARLQPPTQYTRRLLAIEVAQYALWISADVFILLGYDAGYLLRIVPNVIYYAAFAPVAALRSPDDARA